MVSTTAGGGPLKSAREVTKSVSPISYYYSLYKLMAQIACGCKIAKMAQMHQMTHGPL